jgi:hypothetical protein
MIVAHFPLRQGNGFEMSRAGWPRARLRVRLYEANVGGKSHSASSASGLPAVQAHKLRRVGGLAGSSGSSEG